MGASSTLPPLKESDVSFDSSAAVPAGCQNLRNISSYYEHPSHDFAPGQMFTSEEKHFYMFIRDDGLSAPKYISSIKTNYTALDDMANDYSKSTLLLSGCDKVIDRDLNAEDTDDKGGYLGITRTNDLSKATLRGIAVYYVKNGETACPETVKDSNGSTFTKLSSDGIYVGHNYYAYLYTSTAKTLGDPITDITIDDTPYVEGMETAPLLGTHANAFWYIHYKKAATTQMYLSSLDVRGYNSDATIYKSGGWIIFWRAEANKDENVKDELLLGGFRNLLDYEASYRKETGTKYSRYLGYNTTANKNRAITGIIATRGEEWKNQITYNGIIYYPIASRTDLNGNSDYEKICLYWTTDKPAGSPISEINVSVSQYAQSGWNMVCNQNGAAVNINSQNDSDSCGATNNDNACYFTFRRADNSVDRTNSFVASVFSQPAAASIIILGMIILLSGGIVLVVKRVRRAKEAR